MTKWVLLAVLGFISNAGFAAGHENEGGSLCSYAEYTCMSADEFVVACPFKDTTFIALQTSPNETTKNFKTQLVPVPHGIMGAGVEYRGEGLDLKIETDTLMKPQGWISYLTIQSLKVNETVYCKVNHHSTN
jgi:hypothetical protein